MDPLKDPPKTQGMKSAEELIKNMKAKEQKQAFPKMKRDVKKYARQKIKEGPMKIRSKDDFKDDS
jgi:hypothetical protein|tara:strand:- start:255 stop:449 length:195 start_codon:yes stop_codon:yes gene_type:complete